MNRLGPRARLVLGVLVAVLAVVAGFVFAGSGGDTPSDSYTATTGTAAGLSSSTSVQGYGVGPDGSLAESAVPTRTSASAQASAATQTAGPRGVVPVPVPDAAWTTLAEIDAGRWPGSANAQGTKGGDTWRNRDGTLPRTDPGGEQIAYREWDVNPKKRGETRDAERIVTGTDTSAWYTGDHYTSFVRMR